MSMGAKGKGKGVKPSNTNRALTSDESSQTLAKATSISGSSTSPNDRSPGTNDTPPSDRPSPDTSPTQSTPNVNGKATDLTLRQKLAEVTKTPLRRKRRKPIDTSRDDEASRLTNTHLNIDRLIKWNCFLFFTNRLWEDIARQTCGDNFDIDSEHGQTVRVRIFDAVKGNKFRTIENIAVRGIPFSCDESY